ncbi:sulfatase [Pontiellaceae bacterium B12227]|nr:sulfatase [Pontiellaceae bacterium B12227]
MKRLFTCFLLAATALSAVARPNLVVILIDDMGWNDTGFAGNKTIHTPHLDRLAQSGIIFTQAYAAAPNCAPTRACLMTGQYTPRHEVYTVVDERHSPGQPNHKIMAAPSKPELDGGAITFADVLQDAGYATGMVGMWNLGRGRKGPRVPTGQGFDSYVQPKDLGFEKDSYFDPEGNYLTDRLTDKAIEFTKNQTKPFLLYVAYHAVHSPFDPKPETLRKNNGNEYAATIETLDENIGRLAAALPEDTVLIFTSDNGGTRRYVEPLRGGKGTLYEGGLRVPAFACGPGIKPHQQSAEPISSIDVYPTLLELAGVPMPGNLPLDGKSLVPLWSGGSLKRDALFWHFPCYIGQGGPTSAMRKGKYKLLEFFETETTELYDLDSDPEERNNLSKAEPKRANKLYAELKQWQADLNAPRPAEPNPDYDPTAPRKKGRDERGNKGRNKKK